MTTYNSIGIGRTIGAGVNSLNITDFQVSVNSTDGEVTINLPPISDVLSERKVSGYLQVIQYLIADISGTAGTNKITLVASSGDLINGSNSFDLDINNISVLLTPTSHKTWITSAMVAGGGGIISVTYEELVNLINSNALIVGAKYLITDFQTIYDQPDYDALGNPKAIVTTVDTTPLEPLIATAVTVNQISKQVYSTTFPNDVIEYDVSFNQTEKMNAPAKGRISLRIDDQNNRTDYDHRTVKFKRYDDGTGLFTSYKDNGNASTEFLTFRAGKNLTVKDNYIGDWAIYYPAFQSSLKYIPVSFILSNNVFECNTITSNRIGDVSGNNTFTSPSEISNNISGEFFMRNEITIGFFDNTFGSSVSDNIIGSSALLASNPCVANKIGDGFESNTIGSGFVNNNFGNSVTDLIILNDFNFNNIENGFNSVDFSLATLVYSIAPTFSKTITKRSDGTYRLYYLDGVDVIIYASPTA